MSKAECYRCGQVVNLVPVPGAPGMTRFGKHLHNGKLCEGYKISLRVSKAQQRQAKTGSAAKP